MHSSTALGRAESCVCIVRETWSVLQWSRSSTRHIENNGAQAGRNRQGKSGVERSWLWEYVGDGATRAALLTRIGPKRVAVEKKDSIGSEEGGDDARGATLVALKMGKLHANPSLANSTHHDRVSIRFERLRGMGS
jgi:hypothetical protein